MKPKFFKSSPIVIGIMFFGIYLLAAQFAFAVSITPTRIIQTAQPGEIIEGVISIGNSEKNSLNVNVEANNITFNNETGVTNFVQTDTPRGLLNWISLKNTSAQANPGEIIGFEYTIKIPENIAPGTYSGAFLGTTSEVHEKNTNDENIIGLAARAGSLIYITIEGDYKEELELQSFELNNNSFLKGEIIFDIKLKNAGDVAILPNGNIEIFNEKGEKLNEIYAITKTFEGQEVVTGKEDEIPINLSQKMLAPDISQNYSSRWENINVGNGKYTAKATIYYGEDEKELKSEITFEITSDLKISQFDTEKTWNSALPVNFLIKLQNSGNKEIKPTGYITINNIFGLQKERIDLNDENLILLPGIEILHNTAVWDKGLAMGLYSANLKMNFNGIDHEVSKYFWVITWWQIIILLIIIFLVAFLIYKGVSRYSEMKHKMKELEEAVEHKDETDDEKKE